MILMSEILKAREYHRRKRLEELAKKNNYEFYLASARKNPKGFIKFLEKLVKDYIYS